MRSSSSCKFQRYCYVQYEGMFNTIEQVVFIEQNLLRFIPEFKNAPNWCRIEIRETPPSWCRIIELKLQRVVGELTIRNKDSFI